MFNSDIYSLEKNSLMPDFFDDELGKISVNPQHSDPLILSPTNLAFLYIILKIFVFF